MTMIIKPTLVKFEINFNDKKYSIEVDNFYREIRIEIDGVDSYWSTMGSYSEVYRMLEKAFGKTKENVTIFMEIYKHLDDEGKFNMMDNRG